MKKPDRGPDYRWDNGVVKLREIKRPDLVKDPYRVRGQWTKEDGRPGTFDAMNWREARDRADEVKKNLEEGRAARSKSPTFKRVWEEWFATREEQHALKPDHPDHLTQRTLKSDGATGRHILDDWGRKRIETILPIDLEQWLKQLARRQPGSARLCVVQLGALFKFARRKHYLAANPLLEDPIKLGRSAAKQPWVPGWEMMDRLVETGAAGYIPEEYPRYAWSNMQTAIALGFGAGLRISEILGIRWKDIDWAHRVVKVEVAVTERGLPKKQKTRTVPMTQWVYEATFDHWSVVNTIGKFTKPVQQEDWPVIWNRINHGKPVNPCNWNDMLYRFLRHAGPIEAESEEEAVEKGRASKWQWHRGRAFYISARFALGDPHLQIMEAVAHADLETTTRHYAKALPEPPRIWRYRFQPADPKSRILDGQVVDVDEVAQRALPAPEGPEIDVGTRANAPTWMREAYRLLEGGWRLKDVCAHVGKSRYTITAHARKFGLPPPVEVWRLARDRRYAELSREGLRDAAIIAATGTSESEYYRWKLAYEAGIERGSKALTKLDKSLRKRGPVATDRQQRQMRLF